MENLVSGKAGEGMKLWPMLHVLLICWTYIQLVHNFVRKWIKQTIIWLLHYVHVVVRPCEVKRTWKKCCELCYYTTCKIAKCRYLRPIKSWLKRQKDRFNSRYTCSQGSDHAVTSGAKWNMQVAFCELKLKANLHNHAGKCTYSTELLE